MKLRMCSKFQIISLVLGAEIKIRKFLKSLHTKELNNHKNNYRRQSKIGAPKKAQIKLCGLLIFRVLGPLLIV